MFKIEIIFMVLAAVAAVIEAYFDAKQINKGINPEKRISAIVRVIVASTLSIVILNQWVYMVYFTIIQLLCFWIIFDPAVNSWRFGQINIWYIGKNSELDKFARRIGADGYGWMFLKVILLGIMIGLHSYHHYVVRYISNLFDKIF